MSKPKKQQARDPRTGRDLRGSAPIAPQTPRTLWPILWRCG